MSSFHIDLCFVTFPLPLLRLLQNCYCYFCHRYRYFHTTLLLNTLLHILSLSGVVELTTQLLILENIRWLPLCRINKFGLNTLPSKTVAIPYTCGLSTIITYELWKLDSRFETIFPLPRPSIWRSCPVFKEYDQWFSLSHTRTTTRFYREDARSAMQSKGSWYYGNL